MISTGDGLKLEGRISKPKLIIIVGVDKDSDTFYGTILINTNKSPKSEFEIIETTKKLSTKEKIQYSQKIIIYCLKLGIRANDVERIECCG